MRTSANWAYRLGSSMLLLGVPGLVGGGIQAQVTPAAARLRGPERTDVEFKLAWPGVSSPDAIFVMGDLAELGAMDPTRSVELVRLDDVRWSVRISLPVDRQYSFQYLLRSASIGDLGDPGNAFPLTPLRSARTLKTAHGPGTKTLQVHTPLASPLLHWRMDDDAYTVESLELIGPGRDPSETRVGVRVFAVGKRPVEFYLTSSDGGARDPADAAQTYATTLDEIFLQDGELFSYLPAPFVSPMRRAYTTPFQIQSGILGSARTYRVMLPRGYDEHSLRRYPVLYLYDGQHMWDVRAGQFGFWDRDGTRMANLVRKGQVGEVIQVGIDHTSDVSDPCLNFYRGRDCLAPEDVVDEGLCGLVRGEADRFLAFVVDELKPVIDATYRTLSDRQHTFAAGYSYGGVYALYAGWEFTDTFGAVALQSGSFWVPNFTARVMAESKRDLRIYLDTGDVADNSQSVRALRESFLARDPGYVLQRDLGFSVGFDQDHAFSNGGRRMAAMMAFLWPAPREGANVPWP